MHVHNQKQLDVAYSEKGLCTVFDVNVPQALKVAEESGFSERI